MESSDKGGNLIGSMFVDGKNLAVLLLEAGLCKVFAPSAERSQYGKSLFEAEEVAKNARKKLWEVSINVIFIVHLKSVCIELTPEVMWSIMASCMLYVVDKYAWDFYMKNANF